MIISNSISIPSQLRASAPSVLQRDLVGVLGESNAGDTTATTSYGPATPVGVARKWVTSSFVDVATTDFNNQVGVYGTAWKQFALTHYLNTGRGTDIVNGASAGSEFYPYLDTNNWYTPGGGTKYVEFKAKMDAALIASGKSSPDLLILWLGTNDLTSANTTADILTGATWLISQMMTDYPGVRILIMSTSVDGASLGVTARKFFMKKMFRDFEDNNTPVEIFANADSYAQRGYSNGIHFTQAGYNAAGDQAARCYDSAYGKQTRVILSQYDTSIGPVKEAAWNTFINWCITNGCWKTTALDSLQIFVADTAKNLWNDFTNMQTPLNANVDFNVKESIGINGPATKYVSDNFSQTLSLKNTTVTDFYQCVNVHTNSVASGTSAELFSDTVSGARRRVFQTTTPSIIINTVTSTNMVHTSVYTSIPNNTTLGIGRLGTTEQFLSNGNVIQSATSTAGTPPSTDSRYGGRAAGSLWIGKIRYTYIIKYTGVPLPEFESQLSTLATTLAL